MRHYNNLDNSQYWKNCWKKTKALGMSGTRTKDNSTTPSPHASPHPHHLLFCEHLSQFLKFLLVPGMQPPALWSHAWKTRTLALYLLEGLAYLVAQRRIRCRGWLALLSQQGWTQSVTKEEEWSWYKKWWRSKDKQGKSTEINYSMMGNDLIWFFTCFVTTNL